MLVQDELIISSNHSPVTKLITWFFQTIS